MSSRVSGLDGLTTAVATRSASPLTVQAVETTEDLRAIKDDWDRLLLASHSATVFNSWEWNYLWWKHYGESNDLLVLVVRDSNVIVGIAPFYIERASLGKMAQVRRLRFLGTGGDTSPDYLDVICERDKANEVCMSVAYHLAQVTSDWDVIHWTDVAPDTSLITAVLGALPDSGNVLYHRGDCASISRIRLPADWDGFLGSLSKKRRARIRASRRKLIRELDGRLFLWQGDDDLDRVLDLIADLHHKRWQGRARHYAFSSARYRAFHLDIMRAFQRRGWLRLYCLEAQNKMIAMDYCFQFNGTLMQFQRGFDPAYHHYSPGSVLMGWSFENAIENGCQLFDFLKGRYAHKEQFETERVMTGCLEVYRKNWKARGLHRLKAARRWLASRGAVLR